MHALSPTSLGASPCCIITTTWAPQAVARKAIRDSGLPQSPTAASKRKKPAPVVSSTALTPGTEFMHDVCVSLGYFVASRAGQAKWREVRRRGGVGWDGRGAVKGSGQRVLFALARTSQAKWREVRSRDGVGEWGWSGEGSIKRVPLVACSLAVGGGGRARARREQEGGVRGMPGCCM